VLIESDRSLFLLTGFPLNPLSAEEPAENPAASAAGAFTFAGVL